jgi:hypothetical protein
MKKEDLQPKRKRSTSTLLKVLPRGKRKQYYDNQRQQSLLKGVMADRLSGTEDS